MISKLRFSLIAVIMLVLLGFGFQDQAKGQIGLDGLFCPAVPDTTGWLETEIVGSGLVIPDFSAGLIGTVENSGADVVGGLDWQHVDQTSFVTPTPTNEVGSQLVSWWTQKNGRNSYIQVTNAHGGAVTVHVRFHNENCVEIRNFCDTYTPNDTHQYNVGDLFSNTGADISDANLQNVEGWVTITPVDDCGNDDEEAIEHNYLSGQLVVHDSADYSYGVNTYTRWAICFDDVTTVPVNIIPNGHFDSGQLFPWSIAQGNAGVINEFGVSPNIVPPGDDDFQSYVASSANFPSPDYLGGFFGIPNSQLINTGIAESNVSVVESAVFSAVAPNVVTYDVSTFNPSDAVLAGCDNYTAVLLVNVNTGAIQDGECYNEFGAGFLMTNIGAVTCQALADDSIAYALGPFSFNGGHSSYALGETLGIPDTQPYVIQYVSGQIADGLCSGNAFFQAGDTGGLVDSFTTIEDQEIVNVCDGTLDGSFNAMLDRITPTTLAAQFNVLPGNVQAGADAVLINFADDYGPPYRPVAAHASISVSIFDQHEVDQSCGEELVCFTRLGIDDAIIPSEDFSPATPTAPPTITPTSPPPTLPPTPTPRPTNNGGSSSCAIAGNPVQLGTALANVLIPLVPVAFAFGVRAVRRRKK